MWGSSYILHCVCLGAVALSPTSKREMAEDVVSALERMEGTINDVLDFRRLDDNTFVLHPKTTDMRDLVDRVCRHCRPFVAKGVELGYRVSTPGAVVSVDPRRLF